jgi:GLPGLI family protein
MQKIFSLGMKWLFLVSLFLMTGHLLKAQNAQFITGGKIEYEKRYNLYEMLKDNEDDNGFSELAKKTMPKFKLTYYDLNFTPEKSLYKPGRDNPENDKGPGWFSDLPAEANIIFTDFEAGKSTSQKDLFGEAFLIQDTTRRIKWKITDETRVIAGFNCRRANAIIMDSIYVVAFYTDEILAPGGPESFTGLPGMILGIALPHQHVTWFATKVEVMEVKPAQFAIPTKGKKMSNAELIKALNDRLKDWGKNGRRIMQGMML